MFLAKPVVIAFSDALCVLCVHVLAALPVVFGTAQNCACVGPKHACPCRDRCRRPRWHGFGHLHCKSEPAISFTSVKDNYASSTCTGASSGGGCIASGL